jgi:two-component system, NtrC family, sensor kinase
MGAEGLKKDSEIPITHRQGTRVLSAEWVDRLLVAACAVKPDTSIEDAATLLLTAVYEVIPEVALGVCIPDEGAVPIIVRCSPRVSCSQLPDPTRLFPEFAREWVVQVQFDAGSTLHLATDDVERFTSDSHYHGLTERLSLTVGAALRQCRSNERTRLQTAAVRGLRAQVIQSEKLASFGQIAASVVHEINNPLTSIVAYSDFLRKKAEHNRADPADIERLTRISEAADRILRFSRDLIAYSRPSAEMPVPLSVHEIIERALVFCEHVIEQTGVMVERNFGEVLPVRGVAGQLTQVFVNLLTNACHAMQGGTGCLTITTAMASSDTVSIAVTDDGPGIGDEHIQHIFEPFFTTKTDGTGTGLGLSIVRDIIVGHGGTIRADNQPSRGAVFYIELPVAGPPESGDPTAGS